jgi:hypothetical protein
MCYKDSCFNGAEYTYFTEFASFQRFLLWKYYFCKKSIYLLLWHLRNMDGSYGMTQSYCEHSEILFTISLSLKYVTIESWCILYLQESIFSKLKSFCHWFWTIAMCSWWVSEIRYKNNFHICWICLPQYKHDA